MHLRIILILLISHLHLFADPAPFGLEIGKASIDEVKAKYSTQYQGINKYSDGEVYDLEVSELSFDSMQSVRLVFGKNNKLQAVLCTLSKNRFNDLFSSLKQKYKLQYSNIPFVGNTFAKFVNGNTEITLNAPHMSFEMDLNYMDKNFVKKYKSESANETQSKKNKEASQL